MSNELDIQVKDSLFKDKILNFYKNNKIKLIIFFLFLILIPLILQIYFYIKNKKNEKYFSDYLQAELLLNSNEKKSIEILKTLKKADNETIKFLSHNKLVELYLSKNQIIKAKNEFNQIKKNYNSIIFNELIDIKKTIINFDQINENHITRLIKNDGENKSFRSISNQLAYDFYLKTNQFKKANQIKNSK